MIELHELIEDYAVDVDSPEVSGFEHLEMLDRRSEIARREMELSDDDRRLLEDTDRLFFRRAEVFYKVISEIADLAEMRGRVRPMPSHWWWYLDELVESFGRAASSRRVAVASATV